MIALEIIKTIPAARTHCSTTAGIIYFTFSVRKYALVSSRIPLLPEIKSYGADDEKTDIFVSNFLETFFWAGLTVVKVFNDFVVTHDCRHTWFTFSGDSLKRPSSRHVLKMSSAAS